MLFTAHPDHVLVATDWHQDVAWAAAILRMLPTLLPAESPRIILHAGDFGVWRGKQGDHYLDTLHRSLVRKDAMLAFVDGNHEDFAVLHELSGTPTPDQPVAVRDTIWWLPRGYRWIWHNRTWLALGGAVSVDRVQRREGFDWFAEEEITEAQYRHITSVGHADVLLCHDCPIRVPLRLAPPEHWWHDRDLARAQRHRERLQDVVDLVHPSHLIHGHYHLEHDTTVGMPHGPVHVTGLNQNGALTGNFRILDVHTMTWLPTPAWRRRPARPRSSHPRGTSSAARE